MAGVTGHRHVDLRERSREAGDKLLLYPSPAKASGIELPGQLPRTQRVEAVRPRDARRLH